MNKLYRLREAARKNGFDKEADILYLKKDIEGLKKLVFKKGHYVRLYEKRTDGDEEIEIELGVTAICERCFDKDLYNNPDKPLRKLVAFMWEQDMNGGEDTCMSCGVDIW